ncbi:hypothetical protein C8E00_102154 [Chromohalobacter marismortui]|uniref:Uncharacterized protein n=1 Tax=Chromohalobacter marismortui TaxID=42055 RepID=A0A4R7NRP2_9GAMM|nr:MULTISPECIES: hypothetical protein [Chromohalobacter]MCI0511318.1 hypothetical protein [Chromohalobacter sp.]MCI0594070.1 hypothetical protein [Chromohalobacter sp.]TDU23665.1 hypothetical protein C8E00_102154 [Chromohalobacter marismortui]
MRDIYRRLDIHVSASDADIARAIARCENQAVKSAAEHILCVESRKREYDQLYGTLTGIGLLRARMGLSHAPYWRGNVANDFSISADDEYARYAELKAKVARAVRVHDTWQQVRRVLLWGAGLSLATSVGMALMVFAPELF